MPKFVVVPTGFSIGDCGTSSGGEAMPVPILVQPPLAATIALELREAELVAAAGAVEVVGHGEVTPPRVEAPLGFELLAGVVNELAACSAPDRKPLTAEFDQLCAC